MDALLNKLVIRGAVVTVDTETIDPGAAPFRHKERLIVPLRPVAEALGMRVETTGPGQVTLR